jgi:hypothetical protein
MPISAFFRDTDIKIFLDVDCFGKISYLCTAVIKIADIFGKRFAFSSMVNLDNSPYDVRKGMNALPKCRICILPYTALGVSRFFCIYI